jgi:L-ornithine Nalpha-acyltransferase
MPNLAQVASAVPTRLEHITADNLSLKIADTEAEIHAAQRLRYDVFYKEMGAHPVRDMAALERDYDEYDALSDHLLVIDNAAPKGERIIGTYRMLVLDKAQQQGLKLYTETEFDIAKLKAKDGRIMEVSRSCIHAAYRNKMALNMLWKGIAAHVKALNVDYLIGVPSFFHQTDLSVEHDKLAYLNMYHAADDSIRPRVWEEFYHPLPVADKTTINPRRQFMALPSLLKGYLRLGAEVGDGAYIDYQFNCIDIAIIVDMKKIGDRYANYYSRGDA